jgi:hypothetical protein
MNFRNIALEYSLEGVKGFKVKPRHILEDAHFIIENVPVFGVESLKKTIFSVSENAHKDSEIYRLIVLIIGMVALVIAVFVSIVQFVQSVYDIKKHRKLECMSFLMVDHGLICLLIFSFFLNIVPKI